MWPLLALLLRQLVAAGLESPEGNASGLPCSPRAGRCWTSQHVRSLPQERFCDGRSDCPDGADESAEACQHAESRLPLPAPACSSVPGGQSAFQPPGAVMATPTVRMGRMSRSAGQTPLGLPWRRALPAHRIQRSPNLGNLCCLRLEALCGWQLLLCS
ncbi:CD320 antigen [Chelydra serpentina]|uniref:CD320 antigen n=1 Tax=Chelydra serpentina TaxID=8475 RepID=A0A8T1T0V5_CHESE|nr:CD320 antigen [Chelydra serpentina]